MARSNRRSFWKSFTRNFFGFFSRERAGQIASPVTRRKIGLEQLETRWVPATVSWANGVLALQSNIGETITAGTSADNVISYTTDQNFTFDGSVPVGFSGNTTASLTGDLTATSTVGINIIGSTGSETANIASGYSTTAANLTILAPFETVNQLGTATYQGLNISAVSTTLSGDVQVVGGDFDLRDTTTTIGANITINTAFGGASGGTLTMGIVDGPVGGALADLTLTSGSANIGFSNALGLFRPFGTITIGAANDVAMQLTRADVFNQSTQSTAAIHFYGPLTTTTSATINAASVDIAANITTPTLSIASAGAITGSNGALVVSGTTTLSAGAGADITLNNGNNDFGTVNISSGRLADINDKNSIILGTTTLSGRIFLITSGDVTQTGVLTLPGTNRFISNNITLNDPANDFGTLRLLNANVASFTDVNALNIERIDNASTLNLVTGGNITATSSSVIVTKALNINATGFDVTMTSQNQGGNAISGVISVTARNLALTNSGSTVFGTTNLSGTLFVSGGSNVNISQTGPISVAGNASFTANTGKSIDLSTQTNSFGGSLTFGGALLDLGLKTNSAIALAAVTLTGNLTAITSGGDITQTGALVVPGTTTLSAGTDNITLSDAGNNFGTVNITSANVATLNDTSDIILGTSSATTLNVTAAGNITQSGAITTTGNATFTVGSGKGIDLATSINSFGGVLTFGPSSGSLSFLGLNTNTDIDLSAMTLSGNLTAITSGGNITQTGNIVVAGATTLGAGTNNITLAASGNDFGTVNITSGNVVTLEDSNDLVLGTSSATTLNVTAAGNITQSGAITTTGDATFTVGSGKGIDLSTSANSFGGVLTFGPSSGSLSFLGLNTNTNIDLSALTLSGYLTAISTGGNITQTGALVVGGATKLGAGTNNITLSDAGNDFGTVNITSGNVATLRDSNALVLGTTTATTLNVTANGTITQTGAFTIGGVTTLAAGSANDITLGNTTNSFTGLVNVTSAEDLTINTTSALNLGDVAATSVTVNGGAVTVTGNITQTNATNVTNVNGFGANGTGSQWTINQSSNNTPTISNNILTFQQYSNGGGMSSWYTTPTAGLSSGAWTASFDFTHSQSGSDDIGFMVQSAPAGTAAVPTVRTNYSNNDIGIPNSFSVEWSTYFNDAYYRLNGIKAPSRTTGLSFGNGTTPMTIAYDGAGTITWTFTPRGIGNQRVLTYSGLNFSSISNNAAYLGFYTSGWDSTQSISNFNFQAGQPTSQDLVNLKATGALVLNGNLSAQGPITLTGAGISQGGSSSITADVITTLAAGSNNITLNNAGNNFATVNITSGNVTSLVDSGALILGTGTTTTLNVTAGGAITQTGALTVSGTTTLAAGSNNITLSNASNNFGTVNITSANVTSLVDSGALILGTGTTTTLDVTAGGALSQTGALTVSGTTTVAAGSGNNITLDNAGNNFSTVNITSGNVTTLVDTGALVLGTGTTTTLNVTTGGAITQTGALTVSGTTTLTAGSNDITLSNASNNFGTVNIPSGNVVALADTGSLVLGDVAAASLTVNGDAITVNGTVSQTNAVNTISGFATAGTGSQWVGNNPNGGTVGFSKNVLNFTEPGSSWVKLSAWYGTPLAGLRTGAWTAQFVYANTGTESNCGFMVQSSPAGTSAIPTAFPFYGSNDIGIPNSLGLDWDSLRDSAFCRVNGVISPPAVNTNPVYYRFYGPVTNTIAYDGAGNITWTLTQGSRTKTINFSGLNLSNLSDSAAYIGFYTGQNNVTQSISDFTFSQPAGGGGGTVNLNATGALAVNGNLSAEGALSLTGAGITQGANSVFTAAGTTTLVAGTNDITLGNTTNSFTGLVNVTSAQDLTINTTSALNLGDVAASSVTVNGGAVTVTGNITQTNTNGPNISGFGTAGTGSQWVNNSDGAAGTTSISNNVLNFTTSGWTGSAPQLSSWLGSSLANLSTGPWTAEFDYEHSGGEGDAIGFMVQSVGTSAVPNGQAKSAIPDIGIPNSVSVEWAPYFNEIYARVNGVVVPGTITTGVQTGNRTTHMSVAYDGNGGNGPNGTITWSLTPLGLSTTTYTLTGLDLSQVSNSAAYIGFFSTDYHLLQQNLRNFTFQAGQSTSQDLVNLNATGALVLNGNLTAQGPVSLTGAGISQGGSSSIVSADAATLVAGSANNITLSNAGNDFSSVNITSANVATLQETNNLVLGTSSATTLNVTTAGNITQSGAITTTGNATFTVGSGKGIDLSTSTNSFGGVLTFGASSGSLSFLGLNTNTAIALAGINLSGYLTAITTAGDITQTGAVVVAGTTTLSAGTNNITLSNAGNNFGTVNITSGNVTSLVDTGALVLGTTTSTTLNVTAGGALTQTGAIVVSGTTTLTAGSNNITLSNASNNFGTVNIPSGNVVALADTGSLMLGDVAAVSLTVNGDAITVNGTVSQTNAVNTISGFANAGTGDQWLVNTNGNGTAGFSTNVLSFTAAPAASYASSWYGNTLAGLTSGPWTAQFTYSFPTATPWAHLGFMVQSMGSNALPTTASNPQASNTGITNSVGVELDPFSNQAACRVDGSIVGSYDSTSPVKISQANVNTINTVVYDGNGNITWTLTQGSSTKTFTYSGLNLSSISDSAAYIGFWSTSGGSITQNISNFSFSQPAVGGSGTLNLNASGALAVNGNLSSEGALSLTGAGITQGASSVFTAAGTTTLAGGSGNITLSNASNSFSTVNITSGNVTTLVDTGALVLGTGTTTTLNVTAAGAITQTGALTVSGTTTIAAGSANNITLSDAGNDFGTIAITSGKAVTLVDSSSIDLGNITAAGNVSVNSLGITQASGATLNAGSNVITLNGGGGNITAQGTITTTSSSVTALQVQSGNVVSLGVVNVASGTVALSSISGSAIFTGNLTAGSLTVPTGAYDVALTGSTNNITASAVNFQNTGNLTLGDSATDSSTFGQGFYSGTQANIFLGGQILTGVDLYLGGASSPITLVANTTVGLSPTAQWKEIVLNSKVDGAYSMGIFTDYGYGLSQPIGSTTPLTSFQFNGSNGAILANVTTNGPQTYNYLGNVQGTFNTNASGGNGAFSAATMFQLSGDTVITTGSGNISLPQITGYGAYDLSTTTTGTTTLGVIGATPLGNLNITTGTALALPTTTLDTGKNLIVVAGGAITQSGALTVPGTTSLTAGSANPITLANATNDFTGAVTVVSGSALSLADANTLKLGGFSGNGALVLSAPTLNITGALSTTNGNATLTTDNLILGSTLNAGTGTVTIDTATNSYLIDLGGASGANTLGITSGYLGNLTAATLVVGSGSNTGGITVSQPFATAAGKFNDLTLASTGNISLGVNINTTATNGNFAANGPVLLTGAVTIGTGTGNLSLAGTVDGAYALNLQSTGNTTLGGVVGGTTKLASLTTDAPGTTNLNGGAITTTGTQTFYDNVLLGANTTLTATTVTFASSGSLDGQAHSLTVNGNLALDGTVTNVSSITVNGGSTAISTNVTTVGSQIYPGAITISANVVLTAGGDIAFQSTLNSQSTTPYNLTLDATGNVTFSGQVGYTNRLNNINIATGNLVTVGNNVRANSFTSNSTSFTSAGKTISTSLAGQDGGAVSITTTGSLTTGTIGTSGGTQSDQYGDGYNAGTITLTGGTLSVGTITGTGSNAFDSDNGGSGGLVSINGATVSLTGNITTSGGAGFNGPASGGSVSVLGALSLSANRRISTGAGAGDISLQGITGNSYNLQLVSGAGSTTVSGAVTGVGALTLQENALTSTGSVAFTGTLVANSLVTYASSYPVSFTGLFTQITSATTFRNTGALILGDSGDQLGFQGGLVATAPSSITTGGYIYTFMNTSLTLGAFTASADTALGAGTGTVTVGPAIIGSGATLTFGLGGASTILAGSITGSSASTSNLAFNTTGSATVSGAAGTLNNITVTNSGGLTFQNTVTAGNVSIASTTAGATVAIQGNLNLTGDLTGAGSSAYTLALAGAVNTIGGAGSFTATGGTLAINDQATDSTGFAGGLVNTAGSTNLIGSVSTVGTTSLNLSAVTLVGNARVVTANGPLTLGTIAGGSNSLGLTSNGSAGIIRVTGAAGNLGIITVSAGNGVNAAFESSLSANSLVTAAANFNMDLLGTATIGGATVFNNTGITTLNGGTLTFQGGVTATAGPLNLGGTIATLNAGATFGDSTLLGATTINTGTGTGSINFQGLLDGAQTLSLVAGAGPVNFGGIVGGLSRLGAVTIASAKDVSLAGAFSAASLTQSAGTGVTSISGPLDTSALAGVNLTTYGISVDAPVSTAASSLGIVRLNAGAGGMTITALGDINSDGAVSLFAAGPGITSAGDITTNDANVLVQNKFMMDGSVSISTGGTGAGDITFGNTINGESDLALNAGTGDIRLRYVGTLAVPNSISIASAKDVIGYYLMKVGSFTQTAGSGTTSIRGLMTDTNLGVNIKASAISILNRPVTTLESGPVTLNATSGMLSLSAGGDITSTGAVTLTGAGGISAQGTVTTTADDITFVSATTLTDALTVRSTGIAGVGNISFQGGITGAGKALVVSSQEGSIAFNGNSTGIGALTLQENSVLASGPVTFNGNLSATSINTYAQDYAVSFLGATTAVTNALTLKNTGLVTLGDQPTDSLVFTGGLVHTAGNTTLNGAVATTNAAVTLNTVSLGGDSSINAGTGNISFMNKVDGSADLMLTGGVIQFTEEVGGTTPLGQLTIASATDLTFDKSVDAAGLRQILGTGTTTLKGEVTTTSGAGVNLAANLVSVQAAVDAGNNPVVLSADNLNITAAVSSGTATTTLTGYSAATVVDLGGKDTAGIVGISQAEQALITAGTLVVGTSANTGGVTVSQSVTTGTFGNLSLRSGGVIAVNAAITTTATSGLVTANATGNLNIAAAGVITSGGAVSLTGSAINTAGNISTTNDAVSFNSPTTLTGAVAVNTGTGAGDILFASTLAGGSKNLTLVSGSGATTLQGNASGLATLTIQEDAATSTGAFAAQGNLAAATVNTFGRNYDVAFTGDTTAITNPLNLLNTGKATLGNGALDTFTLAGLTHTAGNTALHGVFTLTGNLTLNSTALDGDTTIGLGVNDAVFNQTVDGPGALDITGRDVLFSGIVGGTSPLVSLTATDAKTTLSGNVTTIGAQAYNGNLVLGGDVKLATTNSKVTVNGTLNGTTAGQQALTVAAGTGYITLGGVVGGTAALKQLDATGGTTLLAGDVTTTGTQTYTGNLVLTGDVKLATTNSAVNLGGPVNGTNAGLESLTIATGTADVTLGDTVGSTKALEQLAITANLTSLANNVTTAGTQTFNGAVVLTGNATLATTNSNVTVNGPLDANSPTLQGMTIQVGTGNVTLGSVGGVKPLYGLDVTAGKAVLGSVSTGAGGQTYTANTTLNGNYLAQGGGAINFNGPATLAGNSEVDGTSGAVTFGSTLNGAGNSLKLNSAVSVTLTGEASGLDTLGLQPVAGPAGSVSILGNLTANTLAVSTNSFAVSMTGTKATIATPVDFRNIGLVTLGDASSDSFTFNGGVTHTAGATYLAGSIVTSGDKVELGTTTLLNNGNISTAGGDIVLGGTVDGLSAGAQGLTLTAAGGNISIAGKVGDTNALGAIVIASANNTTFSSTVKSAGVTQTAGTGTTTFTGNLTTSGVAGVNINAAGIAVNGQVATTGNGIVRLNAGATGLSMMGGYIDADGAVSLFSSAASGISFTGTVRTTSDNVLFQNKLTVPGNLTVNTTVAGSGANITFGNAMTFTASATLDLTAGTGAIQLRRMDTTAGTSAVVINSVRNLSATQAMNIGSFQQIAGSGNTTFAGTSSLTATAAAGVNITTAGAFSAVQPITATAGGVSLVAGTTLTLSTASVVNAAGAVTLTGPTGVSLGANLTATNSNLTVTGAATLTGDVTVTAGTGNVSFSSTINGAKALSVNASGLTSFLGSVGNTTRLSSLSTNAGGTTLLGGAVVQTNGPISIQDAVVLAGSTVISSNGAAITLNGTIDGNKSGVQTLGLTAGSANITVGGAVGGTTPLGAISINSANVTSFAAGVKAASLTQGAGGSTSLLGAVMTTDVAGVNITANAVSVASNITTTGGGVVTLNSAAGLLNLTAMGGITADGAVSLTGSAGIDVGGAITTTNDAVSFNGATRLTSPLTVDTGAGVGNINFLAGVNGSVAGAQGLTLTAGTGDISTGTIGGTTGLGAVTINSARNLSVLDVKATSLTQVASSGTSLYTGNITTTGGAGVNLSGNLVSVGNITSANNPIALYSDRISMNGSVDAGNSSVTLGASSNGTIIDLGGPDVTGTTLGLTNAELSKVTAANLIIGNAANTGGIRVTDSISIASKAMSLTTGSNITFVTGGALAGNLASTEITLNTGLSGGVVGASDTSVDVVANALTVNGGSAGIGANATPLRMRVNTLVTDTNDATDGDQYLAQDPTVSLTVGQGDLDAGSATITLKGGKFYTIAGSDILSTLVIGSGASAGGTGTIQAVTVLGGGNLMPGAMNNPRVGILNTGAVTLTSNGNLNVFAAPASTATGPQPSGVIASSGAVDLGDANLYLTFAQANLRPGQTFEIITGTSVTGTLKVGGLTLFDGDTFEAGSYLFQINYTATSVVITALGAV